MHGSCQPSPSAEESTRVCDLASVASSTTGPPASTDSLSDGLTSDSKSENDEQDELKMKTLIHCCKTGEEAKLGEILLHNEDCINWKDRSGRTPLSYAASAGHDGIVGFLQSNSSVVDPNLADNDGNTPLIYSAAMGHDASTMWLLRFSQINVDQRNHSGFTALMKAAIQDHVVCLKQLLGAGASMSLRDTSRGFTAIEWAKFCGSPGSYTVLELAAAEESQQTTADGSAADESNTGGGGAFRRSNRGSFRNRARPSSVRIRRPAAPPAAISAAATTATVDPAAAGIELPPVVADASTKVTQKNGTGSGGSRLVSFIRRIKLALRFSHRSVKGGGSATVSQSAGSPSAVAVPTPAAQSDILQKTEPKEEQLSNCNAGSIALRNPKLAEALMKAKIRSALPKIKVTQAPEDILCLSDWSEEPEVPAAATKSGVGVARRRDCAGA